MRIRSSKKEDFENRKYLSAYKNKKKKLYVITYRYLFQINKNILSYLHIKELFIVHKTFI